MTTTQKKILIMLKAQRKQKDISKVVEITGFSRQYVSNCLSTTHSDYSQRVVDAMIQRIKERSDLEKAKEAEQKKALEELKAVLGE